MGSVLAQTCVDHRLNHELLRIQIHQKLERLHLHASRIYILNDIGGNTGTNFSQTVELLDIVGEPILLCAVLHHDDCIAENKGLRKPLNVSVEEMSDVLEKRGIHCPIVTGTIRTEHNHLRWSDEPEVAHVPFSYRHT
jgi:hypothetical protein